MLVNDHHAELVRLAHKYTGRALEEVEKGNDNGAFIELNAVWQLLTATDFVRHSFTNNPYLDVHYWRSEMAETQMRHLTSSNADNDPIETHYRMGALAADVIGQTVHELIDTVFDNDMYHHLKNVDPDHVVVTVSIPTEEVES